MSTKYNHVADGPQEHTAVLSVRLTRVQHERLKEVAAAEMRSVSQQVRFAVQASIDAFSDREDA